MAENGFLSLEARAFPSAKVIYQGREGSVEIPRIHPGDKVRYSAGSEITSADGVVEKVFFDLDENVWRAYLVEKNPAKESGFSKGPLYLDSLSLVESCNQRFPPSRNVEYILRVDYPNSELQELLLKILSKPFPGTFAAKTPLRTADVSAFVLTQDTLGENPSVYLANSSMSEIYEIKANELEKAPAFARF